MSLSNNDSIASNLKKDIIQAIEKWRNKGIPQQKDSKDPMVCIQTISPKRRFNPRKQ